METTKTALGLNPVLPQLWIAPFEESRGEV